MSNRDGKIADILQRISDRPLERQRRLIKSAFEIIYRLEKRKRHPRPKRKDNNIV